jgi:hypothetical protein
MTTYIVTLSCTGWTEVEVEADSEDDATKNAIDMVYEDGFDDAVDWDVDTVQEVSEDD